MLSKTKKEASRHSTRELLDEIGYANTDWFTAWRDFFSQERLGHIETLAQGLRGFNKRGYWNQRKTNEK